MALMCALGIGLLAGQRALAERAGKVRESRTEAFRVEFDWPPLAGAQPGPDGQPATWLSVTQREDLTALAMRSLTANPMDHGALRRTGEALLATGWFSAIESVSREPHGVVRIRGQWRIPAAVVRSGDRDHLVSSKGELLPVTYRPDASRLKVIYNPCNPPPAKPGDPWLGGDVQAALALLAYLQPTQAYGQVMGIDVRNYVRTKRLEIVTDRNNRVLWGAPPGEFNPGEPAADVKLKWMLYLRASTDYGQRIDAARPVIDLTNPRGIMIDQAAIPEGQEPPPAPPPAPDTNKAKSKKR
ncbi:MAG: hypothetical protein JNJ48_02895 [Phycisphaerae bacterium]|nr:hypothetical protein [Phycisphaerae bacterium]